ncbi:MAG: competence protein ComEC [Patescibacteria group bacterium]|nr:competence protein ComEC [Patescibacteria group bacterium]
MVYSKNTTLFLYLLISIAILISIAFLQEIQHRRNLFSQRVVGFDVALPVASPTCEYESRYFQTKIPSCESLADLAAISVIGRVEQDSDGNIFHRKRLIIESLEPYPTRFTSLKDWKLIFAHWVLTSRQAIFNSLRENVPPQEAGLAIALVFGNTHWLSKEVKPYFETTGTLHILAASGQNVSLVLMMVQKLLSVGLSHKLKGIVLLSFILVYVLLVGEQPSFIRAACMASLFLFSRYLLQRQYNALYGLAVTTVLLLSLRPEWIIAIGFLLSVFATMGIIIMFPKIKDVIEANFLSHPHLSAVFKLVQSSVMGLFVIESIAAGIAAQMTTVPILLLQFGSVQLLSFIPTTVVSWLIPSIIMFTTGAVVSGAVEWAVPQLEPLATIVILITVYFPVHVFIQLLSLLSQLSWGTVTSPWYVSS